MSYRNNKLESLNVLGIITATSDKQSESFTSNSPRKSIYLKLDELESAKAEAFGLQKYISKEDQTPFFIVQPAENISLFQVGEDTPYGKISGIADVDRNFHTNEKLVQLALVKGYNDKFKKSYFRLTAIQVNDPEDIVEVQPVNPFAQ